MNIEEEIKQDQFTNAYQKAAINLIFTANWLLTRQQEFFKPYGITTSQFNILRILRGQYPNAISGVEIKSRMLDRNSDIPRLLDRLVKKKLIAKAICPNDKRAADIIITEAGLQTLAEIDGRIEAIERAIIQLSPEEATQLSHLLDKLRSNF